MFDAFFALDTAVLLFVNVSLSNPLFDLLMPLVSYFGSVWVWMPLVLLIHHYRSALGRRMIFAFVSVNFIGVFLKGFFDRPRPAELLQGLNVLDVEPFASFPSGHAMNAFMAAYLLAHEFPKYKWHLYGLAVLVCFSRLYMRLHFPTDVVVGALVGLGVGYAALRLLPDEKRKRKGD